RGAQSRRARAVRSGAQALTGAGAVSSLEEVEQRAPRIGRRAHSLVREDELAQLGVPAGGRGFDLRVLGPVGLRVRVREERGLLETPVAGPEARAALACICPAARDHVGSGRRLELAAR